MTYEFEVIEVPPTGESLLERVKNTLLLLSCSHRKARATKWLLEKEKEKELWKRK